VLVASDRLLIGLFGLVESVVCRLRLRQRAIVGGANSAEFRNVGIRGGQLGEALDGLPSRSLGLLAIFTREQDLHQSLPGAGDSLLIDRVTRGTAHQPFAKLEVAASYLFRVVDPSLFREQTHLLIKRVGNKVETEVFLGFDSQIRHALKSRNPAVKGSKRL